MEIKESYGMYYEDFEVGLKIKHEIGRTISEADNTWFTLLTMNGHQIHFNKEYAKKTRFEKILVNSCLTLSIVTGITVNTLTAKAVANLGWDKVRLPAPVFVGDTIYVESEVLEKRKSKKNDENGIITVKMTGYNQDNTIIFEGNRTFMVLSRKDD
jgi:acyl dehydratase